MSDLGGAFLSSCLRFVYVCTGGLCFILGHSLFWVSNHLEVFTVCGKTETNFIDTCGCATFLVISFIFVFVRPRLASNFLCVA